MSTFEQRLKSTDQLSQKLVIGYIRSITNDVAKKPMHWIFMFYDELPLLIQNCFSDDQSLYYQSTRRIRKIITRDKEPPIQTIIDSGIHSLLFQNFNKLSSY